MRKVLFTVLAVAALVGASCSSGGGGGSSDGGGSSAGGSSCTADNATDFTGQSSFTIVIKDLKYHPSCFKMKNGSTITIDNQDSVTHTFTVINTGVDVLIEGGQSKTQANASMAPATYQFHCTIHPQITGTVIVTA
jgi:plastocyanin